MLFFKFLFVYALVFACFSCHGVTTAIRCVIEPIPQQAFKKIAVTFYDIADLEKPTQLYQASVFWKASGFTIEGKPPKSLFFITIPKGETHLQMGYKFKNKTVFSLFLKPTGTLQLSELKTPTYQTGHYTWEIVAPYSLTLEKKWFSTAFLSLHVPEVINEAILHVDHLAFTVGEEGKIGVIRNTPSGILRLKNLSDHKGALENQGTIEGQPFLNVMGDVSIDMQGNDLLNHGEVKDGKCIRAGQNLALFNVATLDNKGLIQTIKPGGLLSVDTDFLKDNGTLSAAGALWVRWGHSKEELEPVVVEEEGEEEVPPTPSPRPPQTPPLSTEPEGEPFEPEAVDDVALFEEEEGPVQRLEPTLEEPEDFVDVVPPIAGPPEAFVFPFQELEDLPFEENEPPVQPRERIVEEPVGIVNAAPVLPKPIAGPPEAFVFPFQEVEDLPFEENEVPVQREDPIVEPYKLTAEETAGLVDAVPVLPETFEDRRVWKQAEAFPPSETRETVSPLQEEGSPNKGLPAKKSDFSERKIEHATNYLAPEWNLLSPQKPESPDGNSPEDPSVIFQKLQEVLSAVLKNSNVIKAKFQDVFSKAIPDQKTFPFLWEEGPLLSFLFFFLLVLGVCVTFFKKVRFLFYKKKNPPI